MLDSECSMRSAQHTIAAGRPMRPKIKLQLFSAALKRRSALRWNRCGNNYGWSRFEGSRCQEAMEERDGSCLDADRSGFTFPLFEYCHPDYYSSDADEDAYVAGVDICGSRLLTGNAH